MTEELKIYEIDSAKLATLQYATITIKHKDGSTGKMIFKLFNESAPQTVTNFAELANSGFYNNLIFHRVIEHFVAQGGCPFGQGHGGPGYRIKCELENNPNKHKKGTLSMAHAGRDTGGSQFFICFAPQPHLDGEHTTFGQIEVRDRASFAVLDSIKQGDVIESIIISESKPTI